MKSRKQLRKEKEIQCRQEEILEVARKIFVNKGFHDTTMDTIARQAGMSKGALYLYFSGKEQLFETLVEQSVNKRLEDTSAALQEKGDCLEKLERYIEVTFEHFQKNRDLITMAMILERDLLCTKIHKEVHEKVIQMMMHMIQLLSEVIRQGIKEKTLRAGNPEKMALALGGMVQIFLMRSIFSDEPVDFRADKMFILETFLKGVKA